MVTAITFSFGNECKTSKNFFESGDWNELLYIPKKEKNGHIYSIPDSCYLSFSRDFNSN